MLLAAVGLHGVMAVSLRHQTREIGIRVALGAEHGALLRRVVVSGATLVLCGIAIGAILSLGLGRLLSSLLFEVDPASISNLATAATVMLVAGLVGAYLPARLVLAVDPARTLRGD